MLQKVEAIIREEKLETVRKALDEKGYFGMTITEVQGRGKQGGLKLQWRVGDYSVDLLPKIKIEVVVLEEDVPKVLSAITRTSRTGEMGDGKIFVVPVENVIRVRTGEQGVNAI